MKYVLTEDLVIPRGTVFSEAPSKTVRHTEHVEATLELGPDNTISVVVPVERDEHFDNKLVELKL